MHYVSVEGLTKAFGIKPLFENISFNIEEGDKIALVARNGSGKSTLLKIIAGKEFADSGKLWVNKDVDIVLFADHPVLNAIKKYETAAEENDVEKLNAAIAKMDELNAWNFDAKVKQVLSRLNIHHLQQPLKN